MTCEEFRRVAATFSYECPHCEEIVAGAANRTPGDPEDGAACKAYARSLVEKHLGSLPE